MCKQSRCNWYGNQNLDHLAATLHVYFSREELFHLPGRKQGSSCGFGVDEADLEHTRQTGQRPAEDGDLTEDMCHALEARGIRGLQSTEVQSSQTFLNETELTRDSRRPSTSLAVCHIACSVHKLCKALTQQANVKRLLASSKSQDFDACVSSDGS